MSKPIIHIIGLSCDPEMDDRLNKWYDEIHIPMVMRSKQVRAANRYRRITDDENYPKYLAVYKFDSQEDSDSYDASPDHVANIKEAQETWKAGGPVEKARVHYELISSFEK